MQRIATDSDEGAASRSPGPLAEIHAHLAVLPMLRVGPYVAHDVGPQSGAPARQTTAVGLRAKLSPPVLSGAWHSWAFAGVGVARVYQPSDVLPGSRFVPGQGGGLLEARLGVGLGYRLDRPWEIFAELGGRAGVPFVGSLYERGSCGCAEPFAGKDSFALSVSLGLSLNQ